MYKSTERISLVSSFAASLFAGKVSKTEISDQTNVLSAKVVGIDWSDGGGMNLLDIRSKEWNEDLLAAAGEGLGEKLGSPVSPNTLVGQVSEYMQERSVGKLVIVKHSSIVYTTQHSSTAQRSSTEPVFILLIPWFFTENN